MTTWENSGGGGLSDGSFVDIPDERRFRAWDKAAGDDILALRHWLMMLTSPFFRTRPLKTKWRPGP